MGSNEELIKVRSSYSMKYAKKNLKRIPLDMQISEYEKLKEYVDQHGLTINGFIKDAIRAAMQN